jgi:hypothetical protein
MNLTTHLHLALRLRINKPTNLPPICSLVLLRDTLKFAYANIPLKTPTLDANSLNLYLISYIIYTRTITNAWVGTLAHVF